MKAAGVSRLIWISSHGVGDSAGHSGLLFERIVVPLRLRAELADKERQEALVTASDLDWTIIRPARLTNGPLTRRLRGGPAADQHPGLSQPGRPSRVRAHRTGTRPLPAQRPNRRGNLTQPQSD
jgi:uncharacterized protein YbjT (DUF2867 family)